MQIQKFCVLECRMVPGRKLILTIIVSMMLALTAAQAAVVWSQPPTNSPGGTIPSQLWFDPTGQNNLDSDAIAYDNFTLAQSTSITRVEWWGETKPSVGFIISFYRQDPNTTAFQPDVVMVTGNPPLASGTYTNFTQTAEASGLYHFSFDLPQPVVLSANTSANPRYFISIVDSMPVAFQTWGWARGVSGDNRMFYYQYAGSPAGGPFYTIPAFDRAFVLSDASIAAPRLTIALAGTNAVALSWPADSNGFKLLQQDVLGNTNWTDTTNSVTVSGTNSQVVVPASAGERFFRLVYP